MLIYIDTLIGSSRGKYIIIKKRCKCLHLKSVLWANRGSARVLSCKILWRVLLYQAEKNEEWCSAYRAATAPSLSHMKALTESSEWQTVSKWQLWMLKWASLCLSICPSILYVPTALLLSLQKSGNVNRALELICFLTMTFPIELFFIIEMRLLWFLYTDECSS